jgi:hypothetical protein
VAEKRLWYLLHRHPLRLDAILTNFRIGV